MTCIVGVETKDGVWIGGDSAGISGWTVSLHRDPKVFRVGHFLYGCCGSFRVRDVLRFGFTPPELPDDDERLDRYMVTEFVPALRACLGEAGVRRKSDDVESIKNASFLAGVRGRLYDVDGDFQIGQPMEGYSACGSGCEVALGALHVMRGTGGLVEYPPELRMVRALEAAAAHNIGVRAPFTIKKL